MADLESVHSKWHSLLECLRLLSEAKEPSPSADQAWVEPLLECWEGFEDWEALWSASKRDGVPALVSTLKKALVGVLIQPAHSSGWLEPAVVEAMALFRDVLGWQASQTADWCTPKWRPLLDLLLAWLPSKVAGAWQDTAVEGSLQERAGWLNSVAAVSLDVLTVLLRGGAGEWARSAAVVQGVEEWLLLLDLAAAEHGASSISSVPPTTPGRDELLARMRLLVQFALVRGKGLPWQGGKTAELLAQKRQLLQALSQDIFHIPLSVDKDGALYRPDENTCLDKRRSASYLASCLLACTPLQPALLGLLTTSSSALEDLLRTHRVAGLWTLAACEELERALAAPDPQQLHEAVLQLDEIVGLLAESSGLLCKLHNQQVQAGAPGTDITQAALYPGCAAAFRAVQLATAVCSAAEDFSSRAGLRESSQEVLKTTYDWVCEAHSAFLVHLQSLSATRYGSGIGRGAIITPASARCLVDSGLLPTLRSARFALGMHISPLSAKLMRLALPDIRRHIGWADSSSGQDMSVSLLAAALSVVADHLEVLEGTPERLAELGQEVAEVAAQLLAAQGRVLAVLETHGIKDPAVMGLFELHWDMLLRLAKLVGRLRERELVSQRAFQGLGYCGLSSLHHLLVLHWMQPPMVGLGRDGERGVTRRFLQLATSTVEVISSLQQRDQTAAVLLRQGFFPLLTYKRHADLMVEAVHDAMRALLEAYPRMAATLVAGSGLLVDLADWVKTNLEALEPQGLGRHPQLSARFNAVQQQVGRLVRLCCQLVGEAGDAGLLEEDQAIEAASKAHLKQLLTAAPATAGGPRAAAVAASLLAWQRRCDELLPRLQRFVWQSTLWHIKLQAPVAITNGSCTITYSGIPWCAYVRDVGVSAAGCCANPWCFQPGVGTDTSRKWRCSACKAVVYCSAECAKTDWLRHGPVCRTFRKR